MSKLKITQDFYSRPADIVAKELLGCLLVKSDGRQKYICRIVETEAYLGEKDLASHASKGKTLRNSVMFGPAGVAYVYFIYGMYDMFNIVTGEHENDPQAVLIRAAEPINPSSLDLSGPGKLTRALKITRDLNGEDLCRSEKIYLEPGTVPNRIQKSKRIGVDYAKHWKERLLRFYDKQSDWVSRR